MTFEFRAVDGNDGELIDSHTIYKAGQPTASTTSQPTTTAATTTPPGGATTLERLLASSADDAEESTDDQGMYIDSSDLELVDDPTFNGDQIVGLRFQDLVIPAGSRIDRPTSDSRPTRATRLPQT